MPRNDPELRQAIEAALGAALGHALRIDAASPAAGRVTTGAGHFFVKHAAPSHPVAAEAAGLQALAATGVVRVPRPIAWGATARASFIALEWLDLRADGDWRAAGRALAALHGRVGDRYGWTMDNSIGASPQVNTPDSRWAAFWRECRLRPQFALARRQRLEALAALEDDACAASDALLAGHAPPPSLLHGDLWRGNLAFDAAGAPVLFDPCVHHGDAECDLAMARLFGGFPPAFFDAYREQSREQHSEPRDVQHDAGTGAARRLPLYQLYHVLNHANLFGGGYVAQAAGLIRALLAR